MVLKGTGVSDGIAVGKLVVLPDGETRVERGSARPDERERMAGALARLTALLTEKASAQGGERGDILESHAMLLSDPVMTSEMDGMIASENCSAEFAAATVIDRYAELFLSMGDALLAARASDLRDIKSNLLRVLAGRTLFDTGGLPEGTVLAARELTTSVAASIDPAMVCAIVAETGGKTSHTAIIARSLGIPAVSGVQVSDLPDGSPLVVVDGASGEIIVDPPEDVLERCRGEIEKRARRKAELERCRHLPAVTTDGFALELCVNIGLESDIEPASGSGADGVGLFRTEFLYMNRQSAPTEEEQFAVYKKAALAFAGKSVIIRTLDAGGDKAVPYLGIEREDNPFLGWRAIRYCLDRPELFTVQLRAILRASVYGNIRIMLPMISAVSELRRAKALIESVRADLPREASGSCPPVGIMVETPAAAVLADHFAQEADFFSIGTNDLTQYTMAADRGNRNTARLCSAYDPAVLRLIRRAARSAEKRGIPCGVCGETAADPLMTKFLIGCGITELSVSGGAIPTVKEIIRRTSRKEVSAAVDAGLGGVSGADDGMKFLKGL
ncbi:MAG: phosphoenolpyruvate--protein phosphotransferase [Clostridiales bacterium]|jgi:phosphotransferase system enzyme I (PtsI)|nr:phosphoenolpyruvate--protein phosphotransferase [Clostridiales bacterium]